jgi:hypothetical protein
MYKIIIYLFRIKKILLIAILFQLYIYDNIDIYALTNQTNAQNETNEKNFSTLISSLTAIIVAIIAPVGTILLAFDQNKKRQKAQTTAHNNNLEYNYSIDLRQRRSRAYIGLWELTQIKFCEESSTYEIDNHLTSLSNWYYDKGHGMLLTEHTQKLFYNFKHNMEDLTINWDNIEINNKTTEINYIQDISSALRTSLLKDIGTRASLRNLPSYDELAIQEPKEKGWIYNKYLEINYAFFGNLDLDLKNKNILFLITNLDKNEPINTAKELGMTLELGKWYSFKWYYKRPFKEELKPGKYSIRITISDIITSEREFELPS